MKHLVAWLIRLAYLLRLRRPANHLQQWLRERSAPRSPLPRFLTPEQMMRYVTPKFAWRADSGFLTPDWSSEPEVFQARLEAPGGTDGDCDDLAAWCAELLVRMPDVARVMRMSCWTWRHGHTVATFERAGQIVVIDYELVEVDSYEEALEVVRFRHQWTKPLAGWVFEDVDLRPIAIYPRVP